MSNHPRAWFAIIAIATLAIAIMVIAGNMGPSTLQASPKTVGTPLVAIGAEEVVPNVFDTGHGTVYIKVAGNVPNDPDEISAYFMKKLDSWQGEYPMKKVVTWTQVATTDMYYGGLLVHYSLPDSVSYVPSNIPPTIEKDWE